MILTTAVCFACALSSSPAFAEDDLFTSLDTNADGVISKTEAKAHSTLSEMFDMVDTNADGFISESEFASSGLPY
ncbi:hypothetical protein KIU71_12395 [Alteromonas sp. SM 2104]|nr:hypothetical protein [Alteromonas oceanisediminis]